MVGAAQPLVLGDAEDEAGLGGSAGEGLADGEVQLVGLEGLGEKVHCTALHGAIGIAHDVLSFAAQPIDLLDAVLAAWELSPVSFLILVNVLLLLFNGQSGLINGALGVFGIDGPAWTTDPDWVKPGLRYLAERLSPEV